MRAFKDPLKDGCSVLSPAQRAIAQQRWDALRLLDYGLGPREVAACFGVSRQTVYNWQGRAQSRCSPSQLADLPRRGRPRLMDEEALSFLEETMRWEPRLLGYCRVDWTVGLLGAHLGCSLGLWVGPSTLRHHLHQLGYVWKRGRYVLEPDPLKEKKSPAAKAPLCPATQCGGAL